MAAQVYLGVVRRCAQPRRVHPTVFREILRSEDVEEERGQKSFSSCLENKQARVLSQITQIFFLKPSGPRRVNIALLHNAPVRTTSATQVKHAGRVVPGLSALSIYSLRAPFYLPLSSFCHSTPVCPHF